LPVFWASSFCFGKGALICPPVLNEEAAGEESDQRVWKMRAAWVQVIQQRASPSPLCRTEPALRSNPTGPQLSIRCCVCTWHLVLYLRTEPRGARIGRLL
jgi:hypothetical protein